MSDSSRGLSVLILNLNKPELIGPLVARLVEEAPVLLSQGWALEVLIGDTGSTDPKTLEIYAQLPGFFRVERNLKYHFSRNNNQLSALSGLSHLVFMNNDVIWPCGLHPLRQLAQNISKSPTSVFGSLMYFQNKCVQHGGIALTIRDASLMAYHPLAHMKLPAYFFKTSVEVVAVTGAFLCMEREAFLKVGRFDESFETECQDVDLCFKARASGEGVRLLNLGQVYHLENATRPKGESSSADRKLFSERWIKSYSRRSWGFNFFGRRYHALGALREAFYLVPLVKKIWT